MKLASWNVNSLRVRLPQVLDWLTAHQPDLVGLQETKLQNAQFPIEQLASAGYNVIANGQKTYNGVALLARQPLTPGAVALDIPDFEDSQRRVVAATCDGVRFINLYVPNGSEVGSDKFRYKLDWLDALLAWLEAQRREYPDLVVVGDFNIAPEDRDVHDPQTWQGSVLVSEPEREKFRQLLALGFKDSFRLFDQPAGSYSWWDYRAAAFRRNLGLRIDHILISDHLADRVMGSTIDTAPRKLERPSDHAPVVATVQL
ncbi:exodeoxyribonuclease III [Thiohalophilus sp.]|uniref:exodeoxyribonuclease III n=1 Tax=Thiohalophilus sp. TaxID=3028392 RepID=UPI003A100D1B